MYVLGIFVGRRWRSLYLNKWSPKKVWLINLKLILSQLKVTMRCVTRSIRPRDYAYYDYILAMDDSNIEDIQSLVGPDTENKIHRLLDFTDQPRNIRDPWYTGNFDESYWDIYEGCQAFLNSLDLRT